MKTALLSLLTALSLVSVVVAGQPEPIANVGQVDLFDDWSCPLTYPFPPLIFTDMPLSLALTTTGGPVLVAMTLTTESISSLREITLILVADNQSIGADVRWQANDRGLASVTRVYQLPAGAHTFGVKMACQTGGDTFIVTRAWLTAYELPLIRR